MTRQDKTRQDKTPLISWYDFNDLTKCDRNSGIQILRAFLSLGVLFYHLGWSVHPYGFERVFNYFMGLCVPPFFIISFYLVAKYFVNNDIKYLIKRSFRCYIEYILFSYFLIVLRQVIKIIKFRELDFKMSYLFILFDTIEINQHLYYLLDLAILFILFTILRMLVKSLKLYILLINAFLIICFLFQYFGLNKIVFCNQYVNLNPYVYGCLFEFLPYCVVGIDLYYFYLISNSFIGLNYIFVLIILIVCIIIRYISMPFVGYRFSGIYIFFSSILTFCSFANLPVNFENNFAYKFLTNYTYLIYVFHFQVCAIIVQVFKGILHIELSQIQKVFLTYILCCVVGFVLDLLVMKIKKYRRE